MQWYGFKTKGLLPDCNKMEQLVYSRKAVKTFCLFLREITIFQAIFKKLL
jgi:hypothetical protein